MVIRYEIVYDDFGEKVIIGEFTSTHGLTVDQALELIGVDMDDYAKNQGWDGYDWNSLYIRIK